MEENHRLDRLARAQERANAEAQRANRARETLSEYASAPASDIGRDRRRSRAAASARRSRRARDEYAEAGTSSPRRRALHAGASAAAVAVALLPLVWQPTASEGVRGATLVALAAVVGVRYALGGWWLACRIGALDVTLFIVGLGVGQVDQRGAFGQEPLNPIGAIVAVFVYMVIAAAASAALSRMPRPTGSRPTLNPARVGADAAANHSSSDASSSGADTVHLVAANGDVAAAILPQSSERSVEVDSTAVARSDADPDDVGAALTAADAEIAQGRVTEAFDRLVRTASRTEGDDRERVRTHLVGLFGLFPTDDGRVTKARRALARVLF